MSQLRVGRRVAAALAEGQAVVALESTIIAHGLPKPRSLEAAQLLEQAVEEHGAVPAYVAIIAGVPTVGLEAEELELLALGPDIVKVSSRDLAPAIALRRNGATTVATTAALARQAGIRVFATGGLGGVHRGAAETFDESADLAALATTPITAVAAGVKSILDIAATLERLETLGVTVLGYQTSRFPGFYVTDSGFDLPWTVDTPAQVADIMAAADGMMLRNAIFVANPISEELQLEPAEHDRILASGLATAATNGVRGRELTPFLLAHLHELTLGASVETNIALVEANAHLAADIAVAWAARTTPVVESITR